VSFVQTKYSVVSVECALNVIHFFLPHLRLSWCIRQLYVGCQCDVELSEPFCFAHTLFLWPAGTVGSASRCWVTTSRARCVSRRVSPPTGSCCLTATIPTHYADSSSDFTDGRCQSSYASGQSTSRPSNFNRSSITDIPLQTHQPKMSGEPAVNCLYNINFKFRLWSFTLWRRAVRQTSVFRWNVQLPWYCGYLEDEGNLFRRNFVTYLPNYTVSHPVIFKSTSGKFSNFKYCITILGCEIT